MFKKVLIVDDDETMLDLLEIFFCRYNCAVTRAVDGNTAIKAMRVGDYDVVITDLQMGRTSGLDVTRAAKAMHPATIVFMITGCNDSKSESEAFRLGVDDYLLKPFSFQNIVDRLKEKAISLEKRYAVVKPRAVSECFTSC